MREIFPAASAAIIRETRGGETWRNPIRDATGATGARLHLNNWNERANGRIGWDRSRCENQRSLIIL